MENSDIRGRRAAPGEIKPVHRLKGAPKKMNESERRDTCDISKDGRVTSGKLLNQLSSRARWPLLRRNKGS